MTATTSPTVALPEAMSTRPNQSTAMIQTFIISSMNGIVVSVRRSAEIVPFINLPLKPAKRSISWPIRTKTRISRMPVRFSWMTPLTASSLRCTLRNSSAAFLIIHTTTMSSTGTMTTSSRPNLGFTITAIIMLPITTRGTRVMKRRLMKTVS